MSWVTANNFFKVGPIDMIQLLPFHETLDKMTIHGKSNFHRKKFFEKPWQIELSLLSVLVEFSTCVLASVQSHQSLPFLHNQYGDYTKIKTPTKI